MRTADKWKDYELIDASGGERLERWGEIILIRPDPQVIWNTDANALQAIFLVFGKMLTQDIFEAQRAEEIGRYLENFPIGGIFLTEN